MKRIAKAFSLLAIVLVSHLPFAVHADLLEDILDRQKIRVGVSLFTPWALMDKNGELTGFEIEVANKLAREMGVETEFKIYSWTDLIPALNRGEIDVIIAGLGITPKRALQLNFTLPYAESGVALATNTAMTKDIEDLRELNSPQIIVTAAAKTLGSDVAKMMFDNADLRIVATADQAAQALLDGEAHAYVGSTVETAFLALDHPDKIDRPLNKPLLVSVTGMGVKRGEQELLNFLNAWITARAADKWLSATHKYWFETLKWRERVAD
jgi:polar amino acid transport system substrate-binding protein